MVATRLRARYEPLYEEASAALKGAEELLAACRHEFDRPSGEIVRTRPAYTGPTDCNKLPGEISKLKRELIDIESSFRRECRELRLHSKYCNLR